MAAATLAGVAQTFEFTAELFRWEGDAAWHFLAGPDDVTDEIDERWGAVAGGFGAVRVEVTIGTTTWRTSIFPDSRRKCYVLPVKKAVRTAQDLADGSSADVALTVLL